MNKNVFAAIVLFSSVMSHADGITCTWIGNKNRVILSAQIFYPGLELKQAKIYKINSSELNLSSSYLKSEAIHTGKFKNHLSFKYSVVGSKKEKQIIFPSDFYDNETFIAYNANLGGSGFDHLVCKIEYME